MIIPTPINHNRSQIQINQSMKVSWRVFRTIARQFGGKAIEASQYTILSNPVSRQMFPWNDMSSGLTIEWIKERINGGNLIETILDIETLSLVAPFLMNNMLSIKSLECNIMTYYHNGLHNNTFTYYLKDFVTPSSGFVSSFPYTNLSRGFIRKHYHIILFGQFAMAAYVDQHGKMDFYEPYLGEAKHLRTSSFVRAYILNLADAAVAQSDPTLSIQQRGTLLCDVMAKRKIVVLSYS